MIRKLLAAALCAVGTAAHAQTDTAAAYTLQRCIALAWENNLQVRQAGWQAETNRTAVTGAWGNVLPYVAGTVNHGINQGRGLDPTTNTYLDQQISFANYNLNASLPLWNGLSLQNAVQQARLAYEAGKMDLQQTRENIAVSVMLAYLQVLSSDEQVNQARLQMAVTGRQVERLQVLDSSGSIAPAQLHDLRGQLANDRLNEVNMRSNAQTARLTLAQLMNVPYSPAMRVGPLPEAAMTESGGAPSSQVYQAATANLPQVKAADLRLRSAQRGVRAAYGLYSPSIYAFGNLGTTYSSAAVRSGGAGSVESIPYGEQWQNNRYSSLGIGLRLPILTGLQNRTQVGLARIAHQRETFMNRTVRTQVQQAVEQAVLNRQFAQERYQTLQDQVREFTASFQAAEARFEAGVGNSVDYMVAKNNLDRSRSSLIAARYDLALRSRIVEYYEGKPLQ